MRGEAFSFMMSLIVEAGIPVIRDTCLTDNSLFAIMMSNNIFMEILFVDFCVLFKTIQTNLRGNAAMFIFQKLLDKFKLQSTRDMEAAALPSPSPSELAASLLKKAHCLVDILNTTIDREEFYTSFDELNITLKSLSELEGVVDFSGKLPSVNLREINAQKPASIDFLERRIKEANIEVDFSSAEAGKPKSLYKEYAITLLLNAYGNAKPLPEHYPQFYSYECGLTNPALLHQQLIGENFFVPSSVSEKLSSLKVVELKQILQSRGLKVSGKKADLIDRILANIDLDDLRIFFQNDEICYSLSTKGKEFLKSHEDYVRFHRYARYGIKLEEYEYAKPLLKSNICEEILIYIFEQKKNKDKYNRLYHYILSQLYDTVKCPENALHEFLIVKYFDINYINAFRWLQNELQYSAFSEATQRVFETQKNCLAFSPNDAAYIAQHAAAYSHVTAGSIYMEYPLENLLVSESRFYSMLSEIYDESFFDILKWNTYFLKQLKYHFKVN